MELQTGKVGNIITRVNVNVSAESRLGDLLNVFWKAGSFWCEAASSETDTVLNLEMIQLQYK